MRYSILIISFLFFSCSKNFYKNLPSCIVDKINTFKSEPKQNPPRSVTQYIYNKRVVYYIISPCCDQYNPVYDENCNYLGSPDGGFTGKGDGKLPNFFNEATDEKLIWKDNR